jgi:flagellin
MGISVRTNIASLQAQRRLGESTDALGRVFERLSSGRRINRASDDAAGLAVASTLTSSARVYTQAIRNANDGFSALNIAQGTLNQLSSVAERARELATGAANGTLSRTQRLASDGEAKALAAEFNRLVETTTFNGSRLLDGNLRDLLLQLGFGTNESLRVGLGSGLGRNIGTGVFTPGSAVTGQEGSNEGISGDFNGDGNLDLAVNNLLVGQVRVSFGDGRGSFSGGTTLTFAGVGLASSLRVADFNGDGRDDILGQSNGNLYVATSNGSTFAAPTLLASGISDATVGDFDADGRQDIAYLVGANLLSRLGTGSGTFGAASTVAVGMTALYVRSGDFNGDGSADLVVTDGTTARTITGNGRGGFALGASTTLTDQGSESWVVGDFNQDGISDLGYLNAGKGFTVALGRSNGSFAAGASYGTGSFRGNLELTDINGDGYLDAFVGSDNDSAAYVLGAADGTFGTARTLTLSGLAGSGVLTIAGDFDRDGVMDFYANDSGTGFDSFMFRQGSTQTGTIATFNISTRDAARASLNIIDGILGRIATENSGIGAAQSRLSSALNTLQTRSENYLAAAGRITDADIADESSNAIRLRILQQSAAAVLAQANTAPDLALMLLR